MKRDKVLKWFGGFIIAAVLIGWLSNPEVWGAIKGFFSNLF